MSDWRRKYDERTGTSQPVTTWLAERAEAAHKKYENSIKALYRSDGIKVYSDAEHAERASSFKAERDRELRKIEAECQADQERFASEIHAREGAGDPTSLLTEDELIAASARREFVNDDVSNLSTSALKARLREVVASGDRASAFCYYVAASRRANAIAQSNDYGIGDLELERLVDELRAVVIGEERLKDIAHRREEIADLEKVKSLAYSLRHGARTSVGAYINQTYGHAKERL